MYMDNGDFGPGVQRSWLSVQIAYDQSFSLIKKKMSVSFSYIVHSLYTENKRTSSQYELDPPPFLSA